MSSLIVGSSNLIELRWLRNTSDCSVITDATVTVELRDSLGDLVAGEVWPKTMSYSNGSYLTTLSFTLDIAVGQVYTQTITATTTDGLKRVFTDNIIAGSE